MSWNLIWLHSFNDGAVFHEFNKLILESCDKYEQGLSDQALSYKILTKLNEQIEKSQTISGDELRLLDTLENNLSIQSLHSIKKHLETNGQEIIQDIRNGKLINDLTDVSSHVKHDEKTFSIVMWLIIIVSIYYKDRASYIKNYVNYSTFALKKSKGLEEEITGDDGVLCPDDAEVTGYIIEDAGA